MNQKIQYYQNFPDTPQNRAAVAELIELIEAHYPEATFEVAAAPEDSQVVTGWIPIVTRLGGTHHGCYLPYEGANDVAYALFSFPSLAAYEEYRAAIRQDPQAKDLWQIAARTRCIRRFDRAFLRPAFIQSGVREPS